LAGVSSKQQWWWQKPQGCQQQQPAEKIMLAVQQAINVTRKIMSRLRKV
jgi:hypothetical protein